MVGDLLRKVPFGAIGRAIKIRLTDAVRIL